MRILLIAPRSEYPDVKPAWIRIPQMSLLILEALTPSDHQVVVVEEETAPVRISAGWDLVAITVMTSTTPRAYALARAFRKLGARVVLGGIHPSVAPEEAAEHADAVVVGEAEGVWERVLTDARRDQLKSIYVNRNPDISTVPLVTCKNRKAPLMPKVAPVIAGRGCPYRCEFCSVPAIYGSRVRHLSISHVAAQIRRSGADCVAFLDDNLAASRSWALRLFEVLRPLRIKFAAQLPASFILDREMFESAVTAGLGGVFVGIETIDPEALKRFRKSLPLEGYVAAIKRCRSANVLFHASLIFGMDEHDASIFDRSLEFLLNHKVPSVSGYVLTPYPGTVLFDRLLGEGRLLHRNWGFYDHVTPVFTPARMSVEELAEGYMAFRENLYSLKSIFSRVSEQAVAHPVAYFGLNLAFRHTTFPLKKHYRRYFNWLYREEIRESNRLGASPVGSEA